MDGSLSAAEASPTVIAAADPVGLWPEPAWLAALADNPAFDWARKGWARAAAQPGAWFDYAKADAVVALWPTVFTLTEDRFAGLPFRLNDWQEVIVRLLVGWKMPIETLDPETGEPRIDHVRLFRRLMLWIPRKNGKSEFLAALALLFFAIEGLVGGQGYVFARDENQAKTPFNKIKSMIANNPELAKEVQAFKKSIYLKEARALLEMLTGSEAGKHGKSPSVILGDEMHEWRSTEIADTLRQGTGARLQPIELYASTSGRKNNAVGYGLWLESQAILEGRIDDPHTLVALFAADPDDNWRDEEVWAKANPSLGLSPTKFFLKQEAAKALDNPRAEAAFRCFHLNQWVDETVRWLNLGKWDACAGSKDGWTLYPKTLKGRLCYGAFDVSSTTDLTALVWVFPPTPDDPKWRVISRFWVPEDNVARRSREDRVPYDRWVKPLASGARALETTPGDYVDQNFVMQAILDGLADFDVQRIGFDPWNARKLVADLEREGVDIEQLVEMRQGVQTLGEPTKQLERLVYSGLLDHGGHPIMRWMAGNAVVRFDENLNFMPAKKRSAEKIDGIVAAVMAVGLASLGAEEKREPSLMFI